MVLRYQNDTKRKDMFDSGQKFCPEKSENLTIWNTNFEYIFIGLTDLDNQFTLSLIMIKKNKTH